MDYYEVPYLMHHGILGMKWGVRRYQNEDGTLTEKGRKKAGKDFITQTDFNLLPLLVPSYANSDKLFINAETKIIPVKK